MIAIGVALYKNWDKIKAAAAALKNFVVRIFTSLKDGVKNIFTNIKNAMVKPIEKARDLIRGIINKIKGFFSFKFKLPHIKLPHFAINPKGWHLGDLLEGVQKKLQESANKIDDAKTTSRTIERKLRDVEELPESESIKLIGEV